MPFSEKITRLCQTPTLTRSRCLLALLIAVIADGLQLLSGPLGWFGFVQVIDVVAAILTCGLLGFHILLLPTFALEFVPLVDLLPTWTGCVLLLIGRRRKELKANPPNPAHLERTTQPGVEPPRLQGAKREIQKEKNII